MEDGSSSSAGAPAIIQHVVVFRFRDDATETVRSEVLAELLALPDAFPQIHNLRLGVNESKRDDRFEYGITMEFDSVAELDAYLTSERHERFVAERFRPNIAERAIVSFTPVTATPAAARP